MGTRSKLAFANSKSARSHRYRKSKLCLSYVRFVPLGLRAKVYKEEGFISWTTVTPSLIYNFCPSAAAAPSLPETHLQPASYMANSTHCNGGARAMLMWHGRCR